MINNNDNIDDSLNRTLRASFIIIVCSILGYVLNLLSKILVVRYLTREQFGLIALSYTVFNLVGIIAILGLQDGVTQRVAYFKEKGDFNRLWGVVISAFELILLSSIFIIVLSYIFKFQIADLFKKTQISTVYPIIILGLPFSLTVVLSISVFRGLKSVREKVYFEYFFPNLTKVVLVLIVVLFGLSFNFMVFAYLFPIIITGIVATLYSYKKLSSKIPFDEPILLRRELLLFSLPLLGNQMVQNIMNYSDALMIGYFRNVSDVGIYNVARSLATYAMVIYYSLVYFFVPYVTSFSAQKNYVKVKEYYSVIAKWGLLLSIPLFLALLFFPKLILAWLFSAKYLSSSAALCFIALGLLVHVIFGPNGAVIFSLGKTKIIFYITFIASFLNVILNIFFIPKFGVRGAAISFFIAVVIQNLLFSGYLLLNYKIHPFDLYYIKTIFCAALLLILMFPVKQFFVNNISGVILSVGAYFFILIFLLKTVKAYSKNDNIIIKSLKAPFRKLGLK